MTYSFDLTAEILVNIIYHVGYIENVNMKQDELIKRYVSLDWLKQKNIEGKADNLSKNEEVELSELSTMKVPINFYLDSVQLFNKKAIDLTAIPCSLNLLGFQYRNLRDELNKLETRINKEYDSIPIAQYVKEYYCD